MVDRFGMSTPKYLSQLTTVTQLCRNLLRKLTPVQLKPTKTSLSNDVLYKSIIPCPVALHYKIKWSEEFSLKIKIRLIVPDWG